jgi:hypothetical protein
MIYRGLVGEMGRRGLTGSSGALQRCGEGSSGVLLVISAWLKGELGSEALNKWKVAIPTWWDLTLGCREGHSL